MNNFYPSDEIETTVYPRRAVIVAHAQALRERACHMPVNCEVCRRGTPLVLVARESESAGRAICGACRADADPAGERRRLFEEAEAETATFDQSIERFARSRRLIGYLSVFDQVRRRSDGFEEVVTPGAFDDAIRRGGVILVVNHDKRRVVARQVDDTLRLRPDPFGLFVEADVDPHVHGDLLVQASRGELRGSFAFLEHTSVVELTCPPQRRRILRSFDLTEVSLVTRDRTPTYRQTWVEVDSDASRRRAKGTVDGVFDRLLQEAEL